MTQKEANPFQIIYYPSLDSTHNKSPVGAGINQHISVKSPLKCNSTAFIFCSEGDSLRRCFKIKIIAVYLIPIQYTYKL